MERGPSFRFLRSGRSEGLQSLRAMSRNNLPPSRCLPRWSRVGRLGHPGSASRAPVNPPPQLRLPVVPGTRAADAACSRGVVDHRIASLQRNIQFLQQQHQQTLEQLHAEIDYLRRENKELQYKMIMKASDSSRKGLTNSRRTYKATVRSSGACPSLYLEPLQDTRPLQGQESGFAEGIKVPGSVRLDHGADTKGPLITSLHPLQIRSNPSHPPRAPTLQECQVIIHQLSNANRSQSQEIICMKTVRRDIVLSKKITRQNDIPAKTYFINGNGSGACHSGIVLPALRQSVSSKIPDGQRSTRTAQSLLEKDSPVTVSKLPQRGACNALRNHLHK
ncbi:uncharacterized protein LOC133454713 [Cololabis saira]|uniref:uncharacterized protein LOC133454713 n=1 Tax=Cololabis saira TaxID=129043 RepID=UPI002AD55984|nr:uncharacterized protein LOC133454713 [Cololabis saira]